MAMEESNAFVEPGTSTTPNESMSLDELLRKVWRKARVRTIRVWIYLRLPGPRRLQNRRK